MKFYINNLYNVLEFDVQDFNLKQDEFGWYCDNRNDFDWLYELNKSIDYINESGTMTVESLQVNEYDDYIEIAKQLINNTKNYWQTFKFMIL